MDRRSLLLDQQAHRRSLLLDQQAHKRAENEKSRKLANEIQARKERLAQNLADQREENRLKIADDNKKMQLAKIQLSELQKREDNNLKLTTAEIDRKKELELVFANYQSTRNLKEQDLTHGFLVRDDEFQKDLTLKNGEYSYYLERDRQEQKADHRTKKMIELYEVRKAMIKADTESRIANTNANTKITTTRIESDTSRFNTKVNAETSIINTDRTARASEEVARLHEQGQTKRTEITESTKIGMQKNDLQYKEWELQESHKNALDIEDKKLAVYDEISRIDTSAFIQKEETTTKELVKRQFDETVNHIFRKAFDLKYEKALMTHETNQKLRLIEAEAWLYEEKIKIAIMYGINATSTEKEIEEIINTKVQEWALEI